MYRETWHKVTGSYIKKIGMSKKEQTLKTIKYKFVFYIIICLKLICTNIPKTWYEHKIIVCLCFEYIYVIKLQQYASNLV